MTRGKKLLQIGDVARESGVTVRTVRYYLEEGFIHASDRSPGGFYLFEPHVVETVRFISKLKDLGMPLKEIKALYQVRRKKKTGNEAYPFVLNRLKKQKELIEKKIIEYTDLIREIDEAIDLVSRCKGCRKKPNRKNCAACEIVLKRDRVPVPFGAIL